MSFTDLPLATPCLSFCLSFKKVVAGDTVVVAAGGATDTVVAAGGATDTVVAAGGATATDTVVAAAGGTTDTVVATAGGATDSTSDTTEVAAGGAPDTPGATAGGSTEEDKGGQKCTDNDNEYSNKILHYIFMQISPFRC